MSDAAITDYLVDIARLAAAAPHREKGAIYATACQHLGISLATLHRRLNRVSVRKPRKQRSDAGTSALTYEQAFLLANYLNEHIRRSNKRIKSFEQAIRELRADGEALGLKVDAATGEILGALSDSAIIRALRAYGLHPDQLAQPDPAVPLSSPHPNWCWQIDASLCVIYKLPVAGRRVEEIRSQDAYKNKLPALAKVEHRLVQRYLITDHASGAVVAHFGLGGESTEGLLNALIAAFLGKPGQPMRGAPRFLMLDQAGANRSAMVRNLCHALEIGLLYTQPGNPRSKGQVECAHNLFEKGFESGLRLAPDLPTLEELQALADQWLVWFNGSRPHSRHGMSRWEAWQLITQEQLRLVDVDAKSLRLLARSGPKQCPVNPYLRVNFGGAEYDVSAVPDVLIGQKLSVCRSAYEAAGAVVIVTGANGRETLVPVPLVEREGPFQFPVGAARIGEEFKARPDTSAQTAKKRMERTATLAATDTDAAAARKAQAVPFGGRFNPYREMQDYQPPAWLPKRGTELGLKPPTLELPPWPVPKACKWLKERLPAWTATHYATVSDRYPAGVPEADLEGLLGEFRAAEAPAPRPVLKVV